MRVECSEQVSPEVRVVLEVLLHDCLPLAERGLAHREKALCIENLLNLNLVRLLHSLLGVCDCFEELSQQFLVYEFIWPILLLLVFNRQLDNVHDSLDDNFFSSLSLFVNVSLLICL